MNCLEYRRLLLTEPQHESTEMKQHRSQCEGCARFAVELGEFENDLHKVAHVNVPEGLNSRILLRQRMAAERKHRLKRPVWFALAASVLLTLALVGRVYLPGSGDSLEQVVLAHVNSELHHLEDRKNVSLENLNTILRPHGAQVSEVTGTIHYAGSCKIRQTEGAHLVMQGQTGSVTVLLMPGEIIDKQQTIGDNRFQGVLVPVENGSIAIVAEEPEEIDRFRQQLSKSLNFIS